MAQEEDHFREFVTGFADPLSRLAFLLTAGSHLDAPELTNHALAQVRREWREAETTGTPEAQAVEELVIALPRRGKERQKHAEFATAAVPDDARALETMQVTAPQETPPRSPYAPPLGSELDAPSDTDTDAELLRGAVWTAWTTLPPRLRVPLVFADASVASRRLAGLDVPESFGSSHRQEVATADAMRLLRARVLSDLPQVGADSLAGGRLTDVLDSTLREHSAAAPAPIDPYPLVLARLRRLRLRASIAVAVVVVVLAGAVAVAVRVSTPDKAASTSAAAAASQSGFLPVPVPVSAAPAPASALAAQGPFAPVARPGIPTMVVPWVTRGTAANDAELIANLKAYFATVHTDAVGQTQVLLATDTSAFRIAYVTANSSNGVIQSWFYGPVGSEDLVEGATSYGGSLLSTSVLADGLFDSSGHAELVVIAPPDTTGMQLADVNFALPASSPTFEPLPYQNGIAVKAIEPGSSADTLVLDVDVGTASFELKRLPNIDLVPRFAGSITSNGPPASKPLPTPSVERGKPDPTLVTEALQVATAWETTSVPSGTGHPVVVWGGTDAVGTRLVVLRVKTGVVDLIVLEWSGDAPGLHGEILIHATAPEVPIAFSYRALDGVRIGVVGSPDAKRATLTYDGKLSKPVALDATGFASFPVTNPSPPPSNDATSDLDVVAQVQLFDAHGDLLQSVPEPPSV
jgi:hypothetical protein